ncbi:hypothetical protein MFLAVUS_002802 [Mucor flavus]|uniref:Uncharacterized protein n=1 Tax=Mucor flavus TaxID=439312 RepID=A0ABP9YRC0_9FUNG
MATFPTWINKSKKNNNSTASNANASLSPRQVANKAYSLAIKKLDKDDKRRRPQYSVRERLLLSNTMNKAEDVLNKRTTRLNRRVLSFESDEDVIPSPLDHPPPAPVQEQMIVTPPPQPMAHIKNESPIITAPSPSPSPSSSFTPEQQMVVSIAVVAAAAYSSLSASQKNSFFSHDFCRPIMIPCHSMNSISI